MSRTAFRSMTGLTLSIPVVGLALPVGVFVAALAALRGEPIPRWCRLLVTTALACATYIVLRGTALSQPLPWSTVGHFCVCAVLILGLSKIVSNLDEAADLLAATAVGNIAYYVAIGTPITDGSFAALWKYGISVPTLVLVLYMAVRFGHQTLALAAMLAVGSLSFVLDSRAVGLVAFISFTLGLVKLRTQHANEVTLRSTMWAAAAGTALVLALGTGLPTVIESGLFGSAVQQRTQLQTDEDAPLLLGGRTEPPLSFAAISLKPVVGWGSVQALDTEAFFRGDAIAQVFGMEPASYRGFWIRPDGFISVHSVLFGIWIESGIGAVAFPACLLALFVWAAVWIRGRWTPLVTFITVMGVWHLIFSPFAASLMIFISSFAVTAAFSLEGRPDRNSTAHLRAPAVTRRWASRR